MTDELDDIVEAHKAETHKAPPHLAQQWHAAIDAAAALERGREEKPQTGWRPGWFFWGMGVTAALALGIGIGVVMSPTGTTETPGSMVAEATPPPAFSRGLQYHLRDSQVKLASYEESGVNTTNLILDIIEQNRLFETAAEHNNAPKVARVLRAFEPILLQLAADDIAPEDADALREQLEFELNVMLTKLARESSEQSHST